MKTKTKVLAALAAVGVLAGCSTVSTAPDEVALHYSGGSFDSQQFQDCVDPSTRQRDGMSENYYIYPAGQRTYKFDGSDSAEQNTITATSQDNVRMSITGILRFELNTDCDALRDFHETVGAKYEAYTKPDQDEGLASDGTAVGWNDMLRDYLGQALQRAVQTATAAFSWNDLYLDPSTRETFEQAVSEALPAEVARLADSNSYFQNFSITLQQPQPPGDLLAQIQQQQVAAQQVDTINAQAAANTARLQQIQAYVDLLGPYGYILYQNQQNCSDGDDTTVCLETQYLPTEIATQPGG